MVRCSIGLHVSINLGVGLKLHAWCQVNNAGIASAPGKPAESTDPEDAAAIFEVNVFSVIRMLNAFLPLIKAAPAGRVVNMSSTVGSFGLFENLGFARKMCMAYGVLPSSLLPPR